MKRIYGFILCSLMLLMSACEKDTEATNFAPGITTGSSSDIYRKGAVLSGSIQQSGMSSVKNYGILFSELESMAEYKEYPITDNRTDFSVSVTGLTPGTVYYYCAYAYSGFNMVKGVVKSFSTPQSNVVIFDEVSLLQKDEFSCEVSVSLIDEGGSEISLCGFCWSKAGEGEPTTDSSVVNGHVENGNISLKITGLQPNETYQVRAYATNSDGVGYSKVLIVKTDAAKTPVLSAVTQKEFSTNSVTVEAQVKDAGTTAVTKAGFCWSATNTTPTTEDTSNDLTAQLANGNSTFSASLDNLDLSTTYYVRAYATNEQGTSYSEVFTFKTAEAKAPVLSAITKKASTNFSVTVEAEITDKGTSEVTASGFCWSTTNATPTTEDAKKDLTGQALSMNLENMTPNTTYYIRAYATNEQGTSYSDVFTFKTAEAKAPVLSAITKKASTDFSVTVEAEITDKGTSEITASGFCWSTTNATPTTEDNKKDLTGQTLSMSMENLTPNTTYYIRAYATNATGTSYSEVFTFKTPYKDAEDGGTGLNDLPVTKWE